MEISVTSKTPHMKEALTSAGFVITKDASIVVEDHITDYKIADKIFVKPVRLASLIDAIHSASPQEIDFSLFKLNLIERFCFNENEHVTLTEKECELLKAFYDAKFIISKNDLLKIVWGYDTEIATTTLETHVSRLRQKLKVFSEQDLFKSTDGNFQMIV